MQTLQDKRGAEEAAVRGPVSEGHEKFPSNVPTRLTPLNVALLTGGQDRHYAVGLATALMEQDVHLEVIGSDEVDGPEFQGNPRVRFCNLHGSQTTASLARRVERIVFFYARLIHYAATAKPRIFHILWNNKLPVFDRTLLMLIYKLLGKKVLFTAHNVNAGRRDRKDSWLNRATLKFQYKLLDHLFVHTEKMKDELIGEFGVKAEKITIIPYGVNNAVPFTELTREEARRKLGLRNDEKTILFFGAIKQYKGLEYLVAAFQQIAAQGDYRLIIAGERKKGCEEYWRSIQQTIDQHPTRDKILQRIEFIPDIETETYFKAADVAVLPYTEIFQSGILFLSYSFGLPVIATDVGSFADDVIEGRNGFICRPRDPDDLATALRQYFGSELYENLNTRQQEIRDLVQTEHTWDPVGAITRNTYRQLLDSTGP
ncbi:glycosyltransferase family 4 protein [Telmatobacter sp. DSM 110680]|uniref:Glycosyltransferase family 4 protein n=1 Tax=Telmatobacter sp. DSM 110680 TaxID=3036704 RepID=A0AAU7DE37_9BACT